MYEPYMCLDPRLIESCNMDVTRGKICITITLKFSIEFHALF
jgi:hypothetical protein